jgi:CheY-like chemotaxis protein
MNLKGKTILIAEDEYSGYAYLEAILKRTGASLLHARNGNEAVEIFRSNPDIDLVLMDLQMPGMDGYQAKEKISEIRPGIPQIAQTAYAMVEDEIRARQAGFNGYISKPIRKNDLIKLIEELLDLPPIRE